MKILSSIYNNDVLVIGETKSDSDEPFDNESGMILQSIMTKNHVKVDYIAANKENWDDEINDHVEGINELIRKSVATTVIILGAASARALYPELAKGQRMSSLVSLKPVEVRGKYVSIINHPKFVMEMIKSDKEALSDYERKIQSVVNSVPDKVNIHINKVDSFKDFMDILPWIEENHKGWHGFDVETNAVERYHKDFDLTLFSWTILVSKDTAVSWVVPASMLDSREERDIFLKFIHAYKDKIITFNCSFEQSVVWTWLGEYVELQDAMVLITMDGHRSSLKVAARRYLGTDLWDESIKIQLKKYESLFKLMEKPKAQELRELLVEGTISVEDYIDDNFAVDMGYPDNSAIRDYLKDIVNVVGIESAEFGVTQYPYEWAAVDRELLGTYCAYDSAYTVFLWDMLYDEYREGYPTYIKHPWLAAKFESYGIRWDDEEAIKISNDAFTEMTKLLSEIIKTITTDPEVKLKVSDVMGWELPHTVVWYTAKQKMRREYVISSEEHRLEELKGIFNPNSNTADSRALFWVPYMTEEVSNATILYSVLESLKIKESWGSVFTYINPDKLNENEFLDKFSPIEVLGKIVEFQEDDKNSGPVRSRVGDTLATSVENYQSEYSGRFAKEVMVAQYEVQKTLLNVDIENTDTWNPSFKLLFDMAVFKKLGKMVSTYIDGAIGRGIVYSMDSWDEEIPTLEASYGLSEKSGSDCTFILKPSFNSLAAITHRWSSSLHTISPNSPTRRCLLPLKENMLMIHADFSQAELVMLAFFSQDANMMQAFIDGRDMHKFVASKAFNVDYDSVTGEQRRSAKGISFGVVYGVSIENLALDMTGGDVAAAQKLFDIFFLSFPALKGWMDARKAEGHKYGYVRNFLGAKIMLDEGSNAGAIDRQSVNYPIQGSSSMIAGSSMYDLCTECDENGIFHTPFCFTHDSLDDFFDIDQMIEYLDKVKYAMQEKVRIDVGAPMSIDMEIGVNGYYLCELEKFEVSDDSVIMEIKGTETAAKLMLDKINEHSNKFEISGVSELDSEEIHHPMEELFTAKGSYNDRLGKTEIKKTLEITLKRF